MMCCILAGLTGLATAQEKVAGAKAKQKKRPNPAFAKVDDDPNLPRVLLIGDSISIGYTAATRAMLKGKANVHRIPTNGGPTTRGVQSIDKWLGKGHWDVIHFNWGLHDLKYIGEKKQVSLVDYDRNLRSLVQRMKKTGAKLIWCSTTPVPAGVKPPRKNAEVLEYNAVATKIMEENEIVTDDLYTFADKQLDKIQRPNNVHFTPQGSKTLAKQVSESILAALKGKTK
ncbi:MAG: SGNH/GDSL hydrolase family protein [Planctomycetaceae bacterium]|nr:SGNH/GDSL hydrolase family protein [Planctomycetaceae bacterium]MBT6155857.1 SGNH/GDSL hydrolase family protein [Planctomycetaceae bacterium]MBT6484243.1 SGNH/GDSL hydrolase family protein [Planctomycetaceae bacterium]MBT6493192.1 SGNH/GDSL hydrolase family protein [Planctomycetaceae bacterium]